MWHRWSAASLIVLPLREKVEILLNRNPVVIRIAGDDCVFKNEFLGASPTLIIRFLLIRRSDFQSQLRARRLTRLLHGDIFR